MNAATRQQAQNRADAIRIFQSELSTLADEGVIAFDSAQRERIHAHQQALLTQYAQDFDIDRGTQSGQLSLGMRIASFLGALALAASVYFLFRRFWGAFDPITQTALLIAAALVTFAATLALHRREPTGYLTKLAALVAFVCFVMDVGMLGQIWDITPSDKALLPWAAYAFLLAYACNLRLLLAAGILCVTAYVAARTGTFGGLYWLDFGERPENFFPVAIALFCLPLALPQTRFDGFAAIYRVFGLLTALLPMLVLSNWGESSYLHADSDAIEGGYQLAGFGLSAFAIWIGARRQWPDTINTGTTFFVIFLYTKFYDWWWASMPKYLFFLVLGLAAIVILMVLRRLRLIVEATAAEAVP